MRIIHIIIWEYHVRAEHVLEFEKFYGGNGVWAKLFNKSKDHLGTDLLRGKTDANVFLTIDRWASLDAYNEFKANWQKDYKELDSQCEYMTERETLLGEYNLVT